MSKKNKKSKEKELCYQWKKGENYSKVDKVQSEKKVGEIDYYVFESGRLINKNLVDEFLVEIPSLKEPLFISEESKKTQKNTPEKRHVQMTNVQDEEVLSESDIERLKQDGKLSLGKANPIPHPDNLPKTPVKKEDNFAKNLSEDGKEYLTQNKKKTDISQGLQVDDSKKSNSQNSFLNIIDKAKQKEFKLNLVLNIKLPMEGFFEILDDDFVKDNADNILKSLINKIKQSDLDNQIKENLIRIYKLDELWQTTNTTAKKPKED